MIRKLRSRRRFCISLGTSLIATLNIPKPIFAATKIESNAFNKTEMIGSISHVLTRKQDTLLDIARNNNLGFVELLAANPGVDPWLPGDRTKVILPNAHLLPSGPRTGLLLNLIDQRLYYFSKFSKNIKSYPIGTGQDAWNTPRGTTKIIRKVRNPTWYVPESIREEQPELPPVFKPGPENPLGKHAMYLGWPSYLIHGTNSPWGVGRRVSHGCIRMYPEAIEELFPQISIGTPVTIVSQEMKIAWVNQQLMVEIHPNLNQNIEIESGKNPTPAPIPEMSYRVFKAARENAKLIDWKILKQAALERTGIPVPVLNLTEIKKRGAEPKDRPTPQL